MHIILIILLVLLFGYSLMLVLANNGMVAVNLMIAQVPEMNLGLLIIATLALGIVIGMLIALIVFRVFQLRWELSRVKKEKQALVVKLDEANIVIEQARKTHVLSDTHEVVLQEQADNPVQQTQ